MNHKLININDEHMEIYNDINHLAIEGKPLSLSSYEATNKSRREILKALKLEGGIPIEECAICQ